MKDANTALKIFLASIAFLVVLFIGACYFTPLLIYYETFKAFIIPPQLFKISTDLESYKNELPRQETMTTDLSAIPGLQTKIAGELQDNHYGYKCISGKVTIEIQTFWLVRPLFKKLTQDVCDPSSEINGNKFDCILLFEAACR